jgi:uncharacterized membrane protein
MCLVSLAVAATMGQIASAFPTAGGLYHWAAVLGGRGWGWATAWFNLAGLVTVLAAINVGMVQFARTSLHRSSHGYNTTRLTLARYLAVALEFQLAADLLSTAIAPTWTAIGKLASIAAVRTALNYFLGREIGEERAVERGSEAGEGGNPRPPSAHSHSR